MSGILGILSAGSNVITDTFNITAAFIPATVLVGYSDGTGGTSGGAGGSISGGTLTGGKHIAEISYINTSINCDRLRIKGLSADPTQAWLITLIANGITRTGLTAAYTWDAADLCATWQWTPGSFGFSNGNTYNGNTIQHAVP
jgi:hypothetical protein